MPELHIAALSNYLLCCCAAAAGAGEGGGGSRSASKLSHMLWAQMKLAPVTDKEPLLNMLVRLRSASWATGSHFCAPIMLTFDTHSRRMNSKAADKQPMNKFNFFFGLKTPASLYFRAICTAAHVNSGLNTYGRICG